MGIQQLLPFLAKCAESVHLSEFSGWTVAIDTYCWIHKGAYASAEDLLLERPNTQYAWNFAL